jgi:hypothetical protein
MQGREPRAVVDREVLEADRWRRKLAGYRERFAGEM